MKRNVKIKRREMKREIKRLKEEIKTLKYLYPCVGTQKKIQVLTSAKILPQFMLYEETIEVAKEEIAQNLGKFILATGFCTVTENDGILGHEIRISCEVVK